MTRTFGSNPEEIAGSIAQADPRILVLAAPPGYDKRVVLRAYAAQVGSIVHCDLPQAGHDTDLARPILDALLPRHGPRSARSAADRLAQRRELAMATSREALRREWCAEDGPTIFCLHDTSGTLATPAGMDLLGDLTTYLPNPRKLVVTARAPLPPALMLLVSRDSVLTVGTAELALPASIVHDIARKSGATDETARTVHAVSKGWPLVCRLLIRLSLREQSGELLEAAQALPHETLFGFAVHRTIAQLDARVRNALAVTMLLGGATHLDLLRVLGEDCDDAVFTRLGELPFIESEGDRRTVHGAVAALLRARFEPLIRDLYERTLHVFTGEGAYIVAARIALGEGDVNRAAAIIDAAPPYTTASVPLAEYERIIDRIDRGLITRYPNLWIATIPYRSFSVDPATFVREAETVYYCLPASAGPNQRAAVVTLLASAYANVGRTADADQILDEALHGFASENGMARATILNFAAALRGIEGRFTIARSLAAEAALIADDRFGEDQRLHYIDSHEAAYRGKHERFVVMVDEVLRRRSREDLPLYRAYAAANGATLSWAAGDDASFERYVTILEDSITPGLEAGFGPIIDAARGRSARLDDDYPFLETAAVAQLYRLGTAANETDALRCARAAARAADCRRDPFLQILAHVAIYVLDAASRSEEAAELLSIVAPMESPELHDAVNGVLHGTPAGMLEPFIRQRVRHEHHENTPRLIVELLTGRVTRDGRSVRLTDKEFEFIALLASNRGMLSRERIGEALWDHLDPSEWSNNFKVTLYRVRTKLAARDVVLVDEGRYRLTPSIEVDLRRAEMLVRECGVRIEDDEVRTELRAIIESASQGWPARYDRFTWAQPLVARINDVVCGAGNIIAKDALSQGRHDEALTYAAHVTAVDPFNERACETTIRLLIDRGDVDDARREFRRYASALADGLGAEPSKSLAELVRLRA